MLLKDLTTLTASIVSGTLFHVEKSGKAYNIDYTKLAKAIVEEYNGSTLGGSAQTVQAAIGALNSSMGQLRVSSGDSFTSEGQGISGNGYSKCLQQLLNSFSAVHKRDIILFASDFNSSLFTGFISMATETVGFFMCTATADATIIKGRIVYGESDCTIWRAIGNTN